MNSILYWLGRMFVVFIQMLPLRWVARLGRAFGTLAYALDGKHRRIVFGNLTACFSAEKSAAEIEAIAWEHFRRIGENLSFFHQNRASMSFAAFCASTWNSPGWKISRRPYPARNCRTPWWASAILAISNFMPGSTKSCRPSPPATTYRAIKQPALDRLLLDLRKRESLRILRAPRRWRNGLRNLLNGRGVILGLLADQSSRGLRAPAPGPGLQHRPGSRHPLALRYDAVFFDRHLLSGGLGAVARGVLPADSHPCEWQNAFVR